MVNRIIKFRALDDGIMVTSGDLGDFFKFIREDAPIMQFTGLLDKHGKEIFEGDLVQYKYYIVYKRWWSNVEQIPIIEEECRKQREDIKTQPPAEIIFRDGGFRLGSIAGEDIARGARFEWGRTSSCDTEEKVFDFEIVGNVFQNPDLLK